MYYVPQTSYDKYDLADTQQLHSFPPLWLKSIQLVDACIPHNVLHSPSTIPRHSTRSLWPSSILIPCTINSHGVLLVSDPDRPSEKSERGSGRSARWKCTGMQALVNYSYVRLLEILTAPHKERWKIEGSAGESCWRSPEHLSTARCKVGMPESIFH